MNKWRKEGRKKENSGMNEGMLEWKAGEIGRSKKKSQKTEVLFLLKILQTAAVV
jgi:hypothetical protein